MIFAKARNPVYNRLSRLLIILVVLTVSILGCRKKDETTTKEVSLTVSDVLVCREDREAIINVSLSNNPGILTMAVSIEYDTSALSLVEVETGDVFSGYSFVPPKNKKNGCIACWFSPDPPDEIMDGVFLNLKFAMKDDLPDGQYMVTVSCPDDGSVLDSNKELLNVKEATGIITKKN